MPPGLRAGQSILFRSPAGRQEACPLSLRFVRRRAPDDIQQPEGRVLPRRDGAQKAALPAAEHQHTIIFPLGTGGREICPHHAAGSLSPGQRLPERVSAVFGQAGTGTLFDQRAGLGVGIAHRAKIKDLLGPGQVLEPGFQ